MPVESATWVNQLVNTNPIGASDPKSQGDDHLRLIKSTLVATFPNIGGALTPTHTELNFVDGVTSAIQAQIDSKAGLALTNVFTTTQTISNASGAELKLLDSDEAADAQRMSIRYSGRQLRILTRNAADVLVEDLLVANTDTAGTWTSAALTVDAFTINGVAYNNAAILTTGTLGAVNGSAVTNLNATALASGTVPDARFPATLPAVSGANLTNLNMAAAASGTLALARGGTGQTTQLGITRQATLAWTIASDPGGTPSGTAGDVFAYY